MASVEPLSTTMTSNGTSLTPSTIERRHSNVSLTLLKTGITIETVWRFFRPEHNVTRMRRQITLRR